MDLISVVFYWHKEVLSTWGQCTVGLNLPTHSPSRLIWVSTSNNRLTVTVLEPELSSAPPAEISDGISRTGRALSETTSACFNSKIHPLHRVTALYEELKVNQTCASLDSLFRKSHITQNVSHKLCNCSFF